MSLSGLYRMSFHICALRSSQTLLVFGVLFLVLPVLCHESNTNKFNIDSVIMEPLDGLRQYVESIVGTHVIQMGAEVKPNFLDLISFVYIKFLLLNLTFPFILLYCILINL